ncbi:MAG: NAD(P)H-hydrate dehydratase, partial [Ruminococcus sp.]|nr:NAD(P)H-hydrate dehydratase [Ruminococcus sp.]
GNNGGDCFVSGKLLSDNNYDVTLINIVNEPSTKLAKENFNKLPENVRIINYWQGENTEKEAALKEIAFADIVIDGVFGTGFHGELDKNIIDIFSVETKAYKLSIDIPSGGNGSTGNVSAGTFKADETICLGCLKFGMTQYPLKKFCGKITVSSIGIPQNAYNIIEGKREYYQIEGNSQTGFPPEREPDAHKGTFGTVLVISGSSLMRGAASFNVLGALKSGAGIVRLASVEKCIDTVSVLAPEATFIELESDGNGFMRFDERTEKILYDAVKKSDSIVIGSGMGVTEDTMEIVRFVVKNSEVPIIIDADGINCIANDIKILMGKKSEVILLLTQARWQDFLNVIQR